MHFDAFKHVFRKVILPKKKFFLADLGHRLRLENFFEAIHRHLIFIESHYK
jgi:hypothetical protein